MYPLYMLQQAGVNIGEAPQTDEGAEVDIQWSTHNQAFNTLINRDTVKAAGGTPLLFGPNIPKSDFPDRFFGASPMAQAVGTNLDPELRLLALSDPIPQGPMICRSEWDSSNREPIEQAARSIDEDSIDWAEDAAAPITKMSAGSIDDFQNVIDVVDALGVDFGINAGQ
jgi:phosphonate transport system substrate-binding protein